MVSEEIRRIRALEHTVEKLRRSITRLQEPSGTSSNSNPGRIETSDEIQFINPEEDLWLFLDGFDKKVRPPWGVYWARQAEGIASRGTCPRLRVGAVIVSKDNIQEATGYNGAPSGEPHCIDVGCQIEPCLEHKEHCVRVTHAEINAVRQIEAKMSRIFRLAGMDHPPSTSTLRTYLQGAVMYCTHRPCHDCYREIRKVGIEEVIYAEEYNGQGSKPTARKSEYLGTCGGCGRTLNVFVNDEGGSIGGEGFGGLNFSTPLTRIPRRA